MQQNKTQTKPRNLSSPYLFKTLFVRDYFHNFSSIRFYLSIFFELIPTVLLFIPFLFGENPQKYNTYYKALFPLTYINITFLIPLIAFLFGSNIISDEVDQRTLTYLTSRPLSRKLLFLSKLASSVASVTTITLVGYFIYSYVVFTYYDLPDYPYDFIVVMIGLILYCWSITAIFAALSALFPRNLAPCIIYFVIVEALGGFSEPFSICSTSTNLIQVVQQIQRNMLEQEIIRSYSVDMIAKSNLSEFSALLAIFIIGLIASFIGSFAFSKRNYFV